MNKILLLALVSCCIITSAYSLPTPQEITAKINENNAKVLDLQGTMITTVKSSMLGGQPLTQRATFYKKGTDKSRVEMVISGIGTKAEGTKAEGTKAQRQIAITNGDESWMIGSDGVVVNMVDVRSPSGVEVTRGLRMQDGKNTDPTAYLKYFDLAVTEAKIGNLNSNSVPSASVPLCLCYLITGTPKSNTELSNNKYFGSIKMYIDKARYVPVLMQIYKEDGSLLMESTMSYVQMKDLWLNDKSITKMIIDIPGQGTFQTNNQTMEIVVEYKGLKVNEGLGDGLFRP